MLNKELKSEMLNNGKFRQLRQIDKNLYSETQMCLKDFINTSSKSEEIASYSELIQYLLFNSDIEDINLKELESYFQLTKAKSNKRNRIKNQIKYYTDKQYSLVFATFTFDNKALNLTNKYRRDLITRTLNKNEHIVDYIGNIDFGKLNEREHYHYILVLNKSFNPELKQRAITTNGKHIKYDSVENLEIDYKKGFCSFELIQANQDDYQKVQNYLAKLTLHALKNEKFEKLIYKKESPYQTYKKQIERNKKERKEMIEERHKKKVENLYQMDYEELVKNIENL